MKQLPNTSYSDVSCFDASASNASISNIGKSCKKRRSARIHNMVYSEPTDRFTRWMGHSCSWTPDNRNGCPTETVKMYWRPAHSHALEPVTPKATVVILYVRHVSESIWQIPSPLEIRTCLAHAVALLNLKDHTLLQQQVRVVYKIPCGTCPKVYIGQTSLTLDYCLEEHREH